MYNKPVHRVKNVNKSPVVLVATRLNKWFLERAISKYATLARSSRDSQWFLVQVPEGWKAEEKKRRRKARWGNSNGEEGGRYAITNAYFRVIVRGAMKGTTCNYHCCGCISRIGRYFFFFLLLRFLLLCPEATLIFAF